MINSQNYFVIFVKEDKFQDKLVKKYYCVQL